MTTVEVLIPPLAAPPSFFRLDTSRLGDGQLAAAAEARSWVPIIADATRIAIRRGPARDGVGLSAEVGTLYVTTIDGLHSRTIRPGSPVRVTDENGRRLFTGTVADLRSTHEHLDGLGRPTRTVTTLTATDAVSTLANTMRYGAVVSSEYWWSSWENFHQRMDRYLLPTGLPYEPSRNADTWTHRAGQTYSSGYERLADQSQWEPDDSGPPHHRYRLRSGSTFSPTFSNLRVNVLTTVSAGQVCSFGMWVRVIPGTNGPPPERWCIGSRPADATPVTVPPNVWTWVESTGLAQAGGVGTIQVLIAPQSHTEASGPVAGGTHFEIMGATVVAGDRGVSGIPLGSIVYESTLANHLDLTANTVRGAWWVDAHGVIKASSTLPQAPVLHLSDTADPSYVRIDSAFDTAKVINTLTLANHGRREDPDQPGNYIADDRNHGPFLNVTSAASYGHRSDELPTAIAVPPWVPDPLAGAVDSLAHDYLHNITTRASESPTLVRLYGPPPAVDVMDAIDVTHRGTTHACRVTSIEHELSPQRTHTNLYLIER